MHYARPQLAQDLADALQGRNMFSDAANGLFLAAPRRTGKSTFLQIDLRSELERRGVIVVYVDLWSAPHSDPSELIVNAALDALAKHSGMGHKALKQAMSGEGSGGFGRLATAGATTVTGCLRSLHELARAPTTLKAQVALIVDEAQHALTTVEGENVMMALKSARDQLNRPGEANLMLVMSGSDRDKLLRLVNTSSASFYGSSVRQFPELGNDFVAFLAAQVEYAHPQLATISRDTLTDVFEMYGRRPQFFMDALGSALAQEEDSAQRFERHLLCQARDYQQIKWQQMDSDYLSLGLIEQAVLWHMLERRQRFHPYDAEALRFYAQTLGEPVTVAQVKRALEALRDRQPNIVWKSVRGVYAVDDADMYDWYQVKKQSGIWPPTEQDTAYQAEVHAA